MSRKFLVSIDLNKNELQNAAIQNLATAPSSPVSGQIYFNTNDDVIYFWNGAAWVTPSANQITSGLLASRPTAATAGTNKFYYATDNYLLYYSDGSTWQQTNNFGTVTAQTSYGASSGNGSSTNYARADHTHGTPALGTATPTAITGTASAGSASAPSKEDHTHAFTPTQDLSMATYKLTNLGTPTNGTDAATKTYADLKLALTGGTMSGAIAMGNNKITGLGTPTSDADAATKLYVDSVAQGLNVHAASFAGTTANLNATYSNGTAGVGATLTNAGAQAAFTTDGTTPSVNDRILVKNQTTASQNGIYTLTTVGSGATNWVLTRATDFDTSAEIAGGDFTFVDTGTTLANTGWVCVNEVTTVGTNPVNFDQFSGAGTYVAGDGLTLTGNVFAVGAGTGITVAADTVSLTNTSLTVNGTAISLGGSGTVTAAAGTLTGATLAAGVTASSLTSFGASPTITTPALTLSSTTSTTSGRIAFDATGKQIEIGDGTALKIFTADDAAATLTNKTISGASNTLSNIANASLTNSAVTVNGTAISLGASGTVTANTTNTLTLGTGLTGTSFNGSAAVTAAIDTSVVVRKYATNVGDGTAVAYTITHNLNTRDVTVTLYENSGTYAEVICDVEHTTVNTVTLRFSIAPTSNQYRVAVQG
jgi:hypothetical protein